MKNILATTALVALTALPAFAQTETVAPETPEAQAELSAETFGTIDLNGTAVSADALIGESVYVSSAGEVDVPANLDAPADDWESAGSIDDIIFKADGQIESVVLDVGGFLGLGTKSVSVTLEELTLVAQTDSEDEFFVVFNGAAEDLEERSELDRTVVNDQGGSFLTADNPAVATESETDGSLVDDSAAEAPVIEDPIATDAMTTDPVAGNDVAADDAPMATDTMDGDDVADDDAQAAADPMVSDEVATGDDQYLSDDDRSALTADDLLGTDIHDAAGERVGSISDIVLTEDGQVGNVIVDVGGFLGIGAKSVAIEFADIEFAREEGGMTTSLRATTMITADQFGAMQEWDG